MVCLLSFIIVFLVGFVNYMMISWNVSWIILLQNWVHFSFPKICKTLKSAISWRDLIIIGKCELYHWIDILDLCDDILEQVT